MLNNRGLREIDLLLRKFSQQHLEHLLPEELVQFEELLEQTDLDIYQWYNDNNSLPTKFDNKLVNKLLKFKLK